MVTGLVLLNVERDKVDSIAQRLSDLKGISEVYSVAGRYDLVVVIRTKDNDALAELVTGSMLKIEGIQKIRDPHHLQGVFEARSGEHVFDLKGLLQNADWRLKGGGPLTQDAEIEMRVKPAWSDR